jgi:hypothetical protein
LKRGTLAGVAGFVIGFVAVCVAVPRVLPATHPIKWAPFHQHQDEYDVVFVGTSEVLFHVIPEIFDAELSRAGHSCRAFNYGLGAMTVAEALVSWRAIRDAHPARLRYVVVDRDLFREAEPENRRTLRNVKAHSFAVTLDTWRAAWAAPHAFSALGRRFVDDVEPLAAHLTNQGKAGDWAQFLLEPGSGEPYWPLRGDGWVPVQARLPEHALDAAAFTERVSRANRDPAIERDMVDVAVERIVDEVRAAGYVPLTMRGPFPSPPRSTPPPAPMLDFSDPRVHPELFELNLRWDGMHLNEAGARSFSRTLAQSFADWLARTGNDCVVR